MPLALSNLNGDSNVATHADEGGAGHVARLQAFAGPQILNICQLYEQGPVVLALFVDAGSCPDVLSDMQALAPVLPRRALRGRRDRAAIGEQLRSTLRSRGAA